MKRYLSIEPLDMICPRGNHHFGSSPGSFGTGIFPPLPSVFAGAIRSFLATRDAETLSAVERMELPNDPALAKVLGTPATPGSFRITSVRVARKNQSAVEELFPLPADLVVHGNESDRSSTAIRVYAMTPRALPNGLISSCTLPQIPVLEAPAGKPLGGYLLDRDGWKAYLSGDNPRLSQRLVHFKDLWRSEARLGIGMDAMSRSIEKGKLFTSDHFALAADVVFVVGIEGAEECLPDRGLLRLGGDGRGAAFERCTIVETPAPAAIISSTKRFRLVLTSPGCFQGAYPPGVSLRQNSLMLERPEFRARLVCAAIPGSEVVSGWDLALNQPKKAERTVPAGAVYWFDHFEGAPEALESWVGQGLWADSPDPARRAEGFNRAVLAAWVPEKK